MPSLVMVSEDYPISLTFPHYQNAIQGENGDFSSGVMVARVGGVNAVPSELSFKNIFSIIKFSLTGPTSTTIKSVTFKNNGTKPISGSYKLNIITPSDPIFPETTTDENEKMLVVKLGDGLQLSSTAQDIYITVPPMTYPDGFTVIFETADGKTMTKVKSSSTTLEANKYYTMTSLNFTAESVTDLSRVGTANSYIVSGAGDYSFKADVIGNGEKGLLDLESTVSMFHTDNVAIAPANAEIIWQDVQNMITDVALIGGDRITFTASGAEGNALIGAKDAEGNIIWSWHIW